MTLQSDDVGFGGGISVFVIGDHPVIGVLIVLGVLAIVLVIRERASHAYSDCDAWVLYRRCTGL